MGSLRNDLTGKKFGHLTALRLAGRDKGGRALWECECDCKDKNHIVADGYNVRSGHTSSCGCEKWSSGYPKDLTGLIFGRLTVIGRDNIKRGNQYWLCKCSCDKNQITSVCRGSLVCGGTTSCGCYALEMLNKANITHGLSRSRIYDIWLGLKSRCYYKKLKQYCDYGGRGIEVCDEWTRGNGFEEFNEWSMNNGYSELLTIDRRDNNGNYSPGNCRWINMKEQCNNTRRNLNIKYKGETKTLAQWCEFLNMPYHTVYHRLYDEKWDIEKAFTKGIGKQGHGHRPQPEYSPA